MSASPMYENNGLYPKYDVPTGLNIFSEKYPPKIPMVPQEDLEFEVKSSMLLSLETGDILPVNYVEELIKYDFHDFILNNKDSLLSVQDVLQNPLSILFVIFDRAKTVRRVGEKLGTREKMIANTYIKTLLAYYEIALAKGFTDISLNEVTKLQPFELTSK